jgi:hypothetical protein
VTEVIGREADDESGEFVVTGTQSLDYLVGLIGHDGSGVLGFLLRQRLLFQ